MLYLISLGVPMAHYSKKNGELESDCHSLEVMPRLFNAILCAKLTCTQWHKIFQGVRIHQCNEHVFIDSNAMVGVGLVELRL